jgi:hypothetical protein
MNTSLNYRVFYVIYTCTHHTSNTHNFYITLQTRFFTSPRRHIPFFFSHWPLIQATHTRNGWSQAWWPICEPILMLTAHWPGFFIHIKVQWGLRPYTLTWPDGPWWRQSGPLLPSTGWWVSRTTALPVYEAYDAPSPRLTEDTVQSCLPLGSRLKKEETQICQNDQLIATVSCLSIQ